MCFRPPELNKLMKQCPGCKTFNPPTNAKCKKCGADMPADEKK
jgi:rRNA maturation endonuclease Nob1